MLNKLVRLKEKEDVFRGRKTNGTARELHFCLADSRKQQPHESFMFFSKKSSAFLFSVNHNVMYVSVSTANVTHDK